MSQSQELENLGHAVTSIAPRERHRHRDFTSFAELQQSIPTRREPLLDPLLTYEGLGMGSLLTKGSLSSRHTRW